MEHVSYKLFVLFMVHPVYGPCMRIAVQFADLVKAVKKRQYQFQWQSKEINRSAEKAIIGPCYYSASGLLLGCAAGTAATW
jgi:hypothetical protein